MSAANKVEKKGSGDSAEIRVRNESEGLDKAQVEESDRRETKEFNKFKEQYPEKIILCLIVYILQEVYIRVNQFEVKKYPSDYIRETINKTKKDYLIRYFLNIINCSACIRCSKKLNSGQSYTDIKAKEYFKVINKGESYSSVNLDEKIEHIIRGRVYYELKYIEYPKKTESDIIYDRSQNIQQIMYNLFHTLLNNTDHIDDDDDYTPRHNPLNFIGDGKISYNQKETCINFLKEMQSQFIQNTIMNLSLTHNHTNPFVVICVIRISSKGFMNNTLKTTKKNILR
jgi:hypothetical protein